VVEVKPKILPRPNLNFSHLSPWEEFFTFPLKKAVSSAEEVTLDDFPMKKGSRIKVTD
jgi:hypothetical protein